ncbi:uncharacterized protein LACBIDRAFT_334996 [Laccaria bicolor S238N-H82]|uniref:Predicted protein n=1 Tax=Laccaria bicolor (strain S238N-H82 / ATCC MYA-4686) TaxID=486041 RepID=B0E110_LACBS|nr:uncharacterized protein LACBIDRAFT_334996 [Laccaria bicolor S238N-H82]EDQ99499.1 predicted protein [Laccaria bicolor S238N-H82]|eukprot:XP_001889848.1 predicted protein [Laccaria bicolor S238N-H82]
MPLLPLANANAYANWVQANANEEGFVNGIWSSILNTHFQAQIRTLNYSINPEVHLNHGFTDLLVTRNNHVIPPTVKWQIIFEGKAGNGMNYQNTLNQLDGYAQQVQGGGGWCYLIAAKGGTCMFWKWVKNSLWHVQPMGINAAGNVAFLTQQPQIPLPVSQEYDIVNDQAEILTMLNYITANPQV